MSINYYDHEFVTPKMSSSGVQSEFPLDSRFSLRLIRQKPCGGKDMRK